MRKLAIATVLSLVLAGAAGTAEARSTDRADRDREAPIVRIIRVIKRVFGITPTAGPTIPIP